jgi:hypothetical protein
MCFHRLRVRFSNNAWARGLGRKRGEEFQTETVVCAIAHDASHQYLGRCLELNFDRIVAFERKVDIERDATPA